MTFALLAVLNRRFVATRAAKDVALWQNVCAALVPSPFAMARARRRQRCAGESGFSWCWASFARRSRTRCSSRALRTVTAHTASVIVALEPVYGIALALLLLGEVPARARSSAAR